MSAKNLGLVLAHPQQLGRGEPRHGAIAGNFRHGGQSVFEFDAFHAAAAIVPQNGRAQSALVFVEQGGTVHLARQSDGAYGLAQGQLKVADRDIGGGPPIGGVLFRP